MGFKDYLQDYADGYFAQDGLTKKDPIQKCPENILNEINTKSMDGQMDGQMDGNKFNLRINKISEEVKKMINASNPMPGKIDNDNLILEEHDIFSIYHMMEEIKKEGNNYINIMPRLKTIFDNLPKSETVGKTSSTPAKLAKKSQDIDMDMPSFAMDLDTLAAIDADFSEFALSKEDMEELYVGLSAANFDDDDD